MENYIHFFRQKIITFWEKTRFFVFSGQNNESGVQIWENGHVKPKFMYLGLFLVKK